MCYFLLFVSVHTMSSRNNGSIFNFNILFDVKVNLFGSLRSSKFKIPNSVQKHQENEKKKNYGKTGNFYAQAVFGVIL